MQREEVISQVRTILIKVLKHDRFEMSDELTATMVEGWDSLTHMVIITQIEEDFKIQFKLKELNKLRNMGTLLELIQAKL
jgi:acyl carrier protein